jgi:hypothetical protein
MLNHHSEHLTTRLRKCHTEIFARSKVNQALGASERYVAAAWQANEREQND